MMLRNPYSASAHGACSREEPQPKFGAGDENRRAGGLGPVQLEIRVG